VVERGAASTSGSSGSTATPSRPVATTTRVSTASVPSSSTSTSTTPTPSVPSGVPDNVSDWIWPIEGSVVMAFGSSDLVRGITLDTKNAVDVKAAADGVVVYAGSGVRGYGNFLILKHSDLYLSAYAYNSELLTEEGDRVLQGQRIARSGKDIEGQPRLYFEIRRDGKPVDPIRYLPRR
jgi:lipoprotein NlpD